MHAQIPRSRQSRHTPPGGVAHTRACANFANFGHPDTFCDGHIDDT